MDNRTWVAELVGVHQQPVVCLYIWTRSLRTSNQKKLRVLIYIYILLLLLFGRGDIISLLRLRSSKGSGKSNYCVSPRSQCVKPGIGDQKQLVKQNFISLTAVQFKIQHLSSGFQLVTVWWCSRSFKTLQRSWTAEGNNGFRFPSSSSFLVMSCNYL